MAIAFGHGDLVMIELLQELRFPISPSCVEQACAHGHIPCLEHARTLPYDHVYNKKKEPIRTTLFDWAMQSKVKWIEFAAADTGHLECITYLLKQGCVWSDPAIVSLASNNNVEGLKLVRSTADSSARKFTRAQPVAAAEHDALEALQYLCEHKAPIGDPTMAAAVKGKSRRCVECLIARGCKASRDTAKQFQEEENLDLFRLLAPRFKALSKKEREEVFLTLCRAQGRYVSILHEMGCVFTDEHLGAATRKQAENSPLWDDHNFNLILSYLPAIRVKTSEPCQKAVYSNNLEALQRLHELKYPLSDGLYCWPIRKGNLEVVTYLHTHGCPLTESVLIGAALRVYFESKDEDRKACINYLLEHGCPANATTCVAAAKECNMVLLQCLREHGVEWDVHTFLAVSDWTYFYTCDGTVDMFAYLLKHRCTRPTAPEDWTEVRDERVRGLLKDLKENRGKMADMDMRRAVRDFEDWLKHINEEEEPELELARQQREGDEDDEGGEGESEEEEEEEIQGISATVMATIVMFMVMRRRRRQRMHIPFG